MKIYVVEDRKPDRKLLEMIIEQIDGDDKLIFFTSGKEAIEKINTGALPDLIILDLIMPVNGLVTLKTLKDMPNAKDVPVAIYTFYDDGIKQAEAIMLGACRYILKSEDPSEEIKSMTGLLDFVRGELSGKWS